MAAEPVAAAAPRHASREPRHGLRIAVISLILGLAADLVIWFVWRPHLPPGTMSTSAVHQQFDIAVMAVSGAPVLIFVIVYFVYAIVVWRQRPGDEEDGPHLTGGVGIQAAWIIGTAVVVLWLFVFGFVELVVPAGAGAGEGPSPIWRLAGTTSSTAWSPNANDMLQVQVIGQQWAFTYRFPQFGGMESAQLVLPNNTPIVFHVTSLDVIHSFWAYQLGVKADANPGVDNVAYTRPRETGTFVVRCNELCGIWHGAMFNYGRVVSATEFNTWATKMATEQAASGVLTALPRFALTYDPTVIPQLGKALVKIDGITGGAGYYYPPTDPVTP
ncbi:MAG TPA: cytochrome c oxidase subunit II [Streptosporangiaceae bacterium]|nr:cytochrome c oxidase subunit II [Streptosporangiaceae bacterium]